MELRKEFELFQTAVGQETEKTSVIELMENQDYVYAIDAWLQDYEMELGSGKKYKKRCGKK